MIELSEYYNKNTISNANSNKFVEGLHTSEIFPFEGIYIGEFESVANHKLPALLSFEETNGLCFLSKSSNREIVNKTIQSIVLRFLSSIPPRLCKVIMYDGTGLGSNLITLSDLSQDISEKGIITSPQELLKQLQILEDHIPEVIQKVLGYKYSDKTLIEYNSIEKKKAEPYRFLIISDYPHTLTKEHFDILKKILKNSRRAGVFVIMSMDTSYENAKMYDAPPFIDILNNLITIYPKDNRYYIKNSLHDDIFRRFNLKLDASFIDNVKSVLEYIRTREEDDKKMKSINLVDYIPLNEHWWEKNSTSELEVPFGINEQHEEIALSITQTSGKNVAIVVGIPGSGKSVFLHTIITELSIHYSPDEVDLYLIDFSGVEFNVYADETLPHAKVIAPESERELGISVLKEIDEEGIRRQNVFSKAGVNNITAYREKYPNEKMPRILVIIDEFQKLFENDIDAFASEAETIIHNIVKEYRKFGINLILATQSIHKYVNKIGMGMIANRVVFEWDDEDSHCLFSGPSPRYMISDRGDCVYNSQLGKPKGNVRIKCYNVLLDQITPILKQLSEKAKSKNIPQKELYVFKSDAKSYFSDNKSLNSLEKSDSPSIVKMYLGEPITISEDHVYIDLQHNVNANILIIGGSGYNTAQRIAINCIKSLIVSHNDNKATFVFFDFISNNNELYGKSKELYDNIPFTHEFVEDSKQQLEYLEKIKEEIERRKSNPLIKKRHIYISIYSYEYAYMFRRTEDWSDMTDYGMLLSYILEHGPLVGIFTILQVSEYSVLKKSLEKPLNYFNHRIALQMSEDDSRDIINSYMASKLYDKRPSSKNRAYYFNMSNNTIIKFKPYEI